MNEIWLVYGECGEYSDNRTWPATWFANEAEAKAFAKKMNGLLAAVGLDGRTDCRLRDEVKKRIREFEPGFQADYTGTTYGVCSVPKVVWSEIDPAKLRNVRKCVATKE